MEMKERFVRRLISLIITALMICTAGPVFAEGEETAPSLIDSAPAAGITDGQVRFLDNEPETGIRKIWYRFLDTKNIDRKSVV